MSRISARDCGFKMVFQYLFDKNPQIGRLFEEYNLTDDEKKFSLDIFSAVKDNFDFLNKQIQNKLKNISLKDLYKLDYAILLVCLAETEILKTPLSIAINESVNLAKKYSTEKSSTFVNGVLSSILKN